MKKIIFSLFLTLSAVSLTAADMKDVFSAMPDSVLPTLTRNNRLDMIDFVSSGMKAVVNDVFNEKSTLDTLTADYLHITRSEAVKVEMKLLPSSRQLVDSAEQVVCMVMTYGTKPIESKVQLFTSKWTPLSSPIPSCGNQTATLSIASDTLSLEVTSRNEENKEEKQLTTLKWNGIAFNKD